MSTCEDENPLLFFKKTKIYRINFSDDDSDDAGNNCETISSVERSYEDFRRLWRILETIYPSQLTPSIEPNGSGQDGAKFLEFALQAALDHSVLQTDEYLLAFLRVDRFGDQIPLIKNVDPPITIRSEYFKKWPLITKVIGEKLGKDHQYQKVTILKKCSC